MGCEIGDRQYTAKDFEKFNRRIHDQVDNLKKVIARPDFGRGETCISAELELYLMNEQSDVSPINLQLLKINQLASIGKILFDETLNTL